MTVNVDRLTRSQQKVLRSAFPSDAALAQGLEAVLSPDSRGDITLIDRSPNEWRSTFPSEVLTCRFRNGRSIKLLCKYGYRDYESGYGHRGGVEREAIVYDTLLGPLGYRPYFYGSYSRDHEFWLFLEYVQAIPRLELAEEGVPVLSLAAAWSGRFHSKTASRLQPMEDAGLTTYDGAYFGGWSRRTEQFARPWLSDYPWLPTLCSRFREMAPGLLTDRRVVIHGEYTPHNVLLVGSRIYAVDWESAAIGPGEIDLASLTDLWPDDLVEDAITAYKRARWGEREVDAEFDLRLAASRIYWSLRWLGNRPDMTLREKNRLRFDQLKSLAMRWGFL